MIWTTNNFSVSEISGNNNIFANFGNTFCKYLYIVFPVSENIREIPTQFHQYLVDKAIQLGYEQTQDGVAQALYFENKFERGIKEAKTFKSRGRVSGATTIKQHSF